MLRLSHCFYSEQYQVYKNIDASGRGGEILNCSCHKMKARTSVGTGEVECRLCGSMVYERDGAGGSRENIINEMEKILPN